MDERLVAVPGATAMSIARVSPHQLYYWHKTDLVPASISRAVGGRRVRLYTFLDLLALTVAGELKQRGVSIQHIRQIVKRLRQRGYDRPLTQLSYATIDKQVYFQCEDGSWEGGLRPDQIVLHEVLHLQPLRERIAEGVRRDQAQRGQTEKRRGRVGGKRVLAGTRIPVETVRRYLEAGRTTAEVLAAYPDLNEADIAAVRRDMAS